MSVYRGVLEQVRLLQQQEQLIVRKALLGDVDAQRIAEEHGRPTADALAANVAIGAGLCGCRRSDGVLCARPLSPADRSMGHDLCYPCWVRFEERKECRHGK